MKADVLNLPFADKSFDRVLMFNVAHHLSVASARDSLVNVDRAMEEIRRVLRDDGFFLMREDCASFFTKAVQKTAYGFLFWFFKKFFDKPLPYFLGREQIINLLNTKGFRTVMVKHIEWGKRVYSPLFPKFLAPRWFWNYVLKTHLFVVGKN